MNSNETAMPVIRRWTWNRATFDAYLTAASVGIFAGLAVSFVNTPLHLPGHKVLFWMVPAVANRLRGGLKGAATTTVAAAQATALLVGGNLAGGYLMVPLVILAGVLLDIAVHYIERHHLRPRTAFSVLAMAGMLGNFLCFVKAMANPTGPFLSTANLEGLTEIAGSHVLFGLLAAVLGGAIGFMFRSSRASRQE